MSVEVKKPSFVERNPRLFKTLLFFPVISVIAAFAIAAIRVSAEEEEKPFRRIGLPIAGAYGFFTAVAFLLFVCGI